MKFKFNNIRYYIRDKYITLLKDSIKLETPNDNNVIHIGDICYLDDENYGIPLIKYKVIDIINNINEVEMNSLILKKITPSDKLFFSLTKQDCETIGIEFEEGLELFPISMNWKKDKKKVNIDNIINENSKCIIDENVDEEISVKELTLNINILDFLIKNDISFDSNIKVNIDIVKEYKNLFNNNKIKLFYSNKDLTNFQIKLLFEDTLPIKYLYKKTISDIFVFYYLKTDNYQIDEDYYWYSGESIFSKKCHYLKVRI